MAEDSDSMSAPTETTSISRPALAAAGLVLLAAVTFRIAGLDHLPGVNGDEAWYGSRLNQVRAGVPVGLVSGSGLPLNPFYSGLLGLLQLLWPAPSFWVLRLPALLSGLALLGLAYPLLARAFDQRVALWSTLLLACLPATIAYSRFGWDQSQAPLAALLCLYFTWKRQVLGAVAAFVMAMVVHPVQVFLAPIMLGPPAAQLMAQFSAAKPEHRNRLLRRLLLGVSVLLPLVVVLPWLLVPAEIRNLWLTQIVPSAGERMINVPDWFRFLGRYGDLVSGITIYRFLVGPVPEWSVWFHGLLFWAVVLFLLARGLPRLVRSGDIQALGLLGGIAVSLAAFYLLAGPEAIGPGYERYAIYLVTPSVVGLMLLLRRSGATPPARWLQLAGVLLACVLLLAGFSHHYFATLLATGGSAHRAFRTGPVEPKQAALEVIEYAAGGQTVQVLAEDWWCYFPIHYLAGQSPETEVIFCHLAGGEKELRRRFVVGFAGGPCHLWVQERAPELPRRIIVDYAGRPVLFVWDLGTSTGHLPGLVKAAAEQPPGNLPK